jgi:hypothetical protein
VSAAHTGLRARGRETVPLCVNPSVVTRVAVDFGEILLP